MITEAFNEEFDEEIDMTNEGTVMVNEVDLPEFEFDDVDFSAVSKIILHPNGDVEIFNRD